MPQPSGGIEELGKSDQERDDSFAWLENLAAKQGASEGLLTKPEERLEQEPEWVKQAKDLGAPSGQPPSFEQSLSAGEPPASVDDTASWLRSLDEEESRPTPSADDTAMWLKNLSEEESKPATASTPTRDDTAMWLKNLSEEESKPAPASDDTAMWLKSLDEAEFAPQTMQPSETEAELPAWMQNIEGEEKTPAVESSIPAKEEESSDWTSSIEEPVEQSFDAPQSFVPAQDKPKTETGSLPSWLRGLDKGDAASQESTSAPQEELPAWLRDDTGEALAEPTKIEPTRATDWQAAETIQPEPAAPEPTVEAAWEPVEEIQPEPSAPQPVLEQQPEPETFDLVEEKPKPVKKAAPKPEPYKEPVTRKGTGMLTMPLDSILGSARNELSRSNIPGALETYGKLIKKARFLDEVIFDLREALYRYPVEVSIWQSLGDAYMRANRLQDALDAYTKAEELLR